MGSRFQGVIARAIVLALAAGLALPSVGLASDRRFALNYKRVPIGQLIERVGTETRRTILFDEQVRGNVSIVTKRHVTEGEAWSILDSSLSMLGFSLLPSTVGNWRISKVAEAVGEAPFVTSAGTTTESFVTALIPLVSASLQGVMNVLAPLSGARVTLVPFEPTHSLIATGPERTIARLTTIADELDRVDAFELKIRVLRYRSVAEVEPLVEARIEASGTTERALQVWSDQRTNSILYRGTEGETSRLSRFLDRVDRPIEGTGRIRILRVLNRDPEEMAELIRELSQPSGPTTAASATAARGSDLAGADFVIAVDKASRSLLVSADAVTQTAVREALELLDEQPQLIAVDITISELRTPSTYALGFGFALPFSTNNDELAALVVSGPGLLTGPSEQSTIFGRVAHDNGVPFTIDGGDGIEIPILQTGVIDGTQSRAYSEVLLQPSLIVTAGEQHEIFVGDNFPVPVTESGGVDGTGSSSSLGSLVSRTTLFERTDVGIQLLIDVKAGREGKIQLDLDIDISSLAPSLAGDVSQVGPTFVRQTLAVTARLDDGETAIIATSRQNLDVDLHSGVPWLADIPFLGWFFRTDGNNDQDIRLVISARASRVSSPAEMVAESIRRRLAFQRRNARGGAFPTFDGPPFAVRVTTRQLETDAKAIEEGLALRGYRTKIHSWALGEEVYFDVYVVSLETMADAAEIAGLLSLDGWETDLVVLPTRS
jgi:type II secretory pathway component GspD/PulD (secretin)